MTLVHPLLFLECWKCPPTYKSQSLTFMKSETQQRHNGEVGIIFMDSYPKLDSMWYFVKDHFPPNEKNYKMFTWWLTCLFCIKFKPCSVLQTGSNLDFLPPCHTQGHCLSLILSFPTHKSRLLSSRERIYQTDWPALSRLQVLGWTFLGLINIFFN